MKNKIIMVVIVGVFLAFALGFVSAVATFSGSNTGSFVSTSYQYQPNFQTYYSQSDINTYWPILGNRDTCEARQDLLLQISPVGCEPAVVRSDLLAEQNVPVFCQVDALQLNPLIDVKSVSNIRFTGNYSSLVSGVGYHPAQAALRTNNVLLGSPTINNIGYVVVVLKRTQNESSLPSFVNLNLKGQVLYDAGNVLGVGNAEFNLEPVADDAKWESERLKNSFWQGRYFVRVEEADVNYAIVSIYEGDRKITTTRVEKGKTSSLIYVPGYYCQVGMQIQYNGLRQASAKARIEISDEKGTESFEVYKGSLFLNGQCKVNDIVVDKDSLDTGKISISCGSSKAVLERKPSGIMLSGIVPTISNNGGSDGETKTCNVEYKGVRYSLLWDSGLKNWGLLEQVDEGQTLDDESSLKLRNELVTKCLAIEGKSGTSSSDQEISPADVEKAFNDAVKSALGVAEDYPLETRKGQANSGYYAKDILDMLISQNGLVQEVEKSGYLKEGVKAQVYDKLISLYPQFAEAYRKQLSDLVSVDSSNAVATIRVGSLAKTISLVSLSVPSSSEEATAEFNYNLDTLTLKKGQEVSIPSSGLKDAKIKLIDFDGSYATIESNCQMTSAASNTRATSVSLIKGTKNYSVAFGDSKGVVLCGKPLIYNDNTLKQVANLRIIPVSNNNQLETNLTFKIGIEKRAIKLSTDKTEEMIKNLNESIKKWDSISSRLMKVETGLKSACFATAAVLTVKNFISGTDGTTLARQNVMGGDSGWTRRCRDAVASGNLDTNGDGVGDTAVKYGSITECFNANQAAIDAQISNYQNGYKSSNDVIKGIESSPGVTTGGAVNQQKAMALLRDKISSDCPNVPGVSDLPKVDAASEFSPYTYSQLRDIYFNCKQIKDNKDLAAQTKFNELARAAGEQQKTYESVQGSKSSGGLKQFGAQSPTNKNSEIVRGKILDITNNGNIGGVSVSQGMGVDLSGTNAAFLVLGGKVNLGNGNYEAGDYLLVGTKNGNTLNPTAVYRYDEQTRSLESADVSFATFMSQNNIQTIEEYGKGLIGNNIQPRDRVVKFFESGVDKGKPYIVPFDPVQGWYAKTESTSFNIGSNQISSFQSNGLPKKWSICNVNTDGYINSNDQCMEVIEGISTNYNVLGLDDAYSKKLVDNSRRALLEAESKYGTKGGLISILGNQMSIGDPAAPFSGAECQEFMSISDCKILFNLCDPVICPASRCNLGGAYQVANVQQTGIVGSALLCFPNAKEGVLIPVCISGIRNGIDAYVSIMKQHRDCLQESLNSGQMIGICDELYSVYLCDFFWRQIAPIAEMMLPKLVESLYSGSFSDHPRGGGEYMSVMAAWDNTKASMNYFTQTYAVNSFKAFQVRSVEDAGSEFCRSSISATVPTSFKSLTEPDSPPQFYARFDSNIYSSATLPATSQYKVFYSIYAGKDSGIYYSVYLKSPVESSYYIPSTVQVANGYAAKGAYASETRDFTAPEGYKELCVRINDEEHCGFKQVTTDFGLNYLSDQYASNQLNASGIKSSKECVSGTTSLTAAGANLNLQSAAQESAFPQISERGIVRICSSINPGLSTDPTRFVNVGTCDDPKMICWLDKNSVNSAISDSNIALKNSTSIELSKANLASLEANGALVSDSSAGTTLDAIENKIKALSLNTNDKIIADAPALELQISSVSSQLVLNPHKARLAFLDAELKQIVAKAKLKTSPKVVSSTNTVSINGGANVDGFVSTRDSADLVSQEEKVDPVDGWLNEIKSGSGKLVSEEISTLSLEDLNKYKSEVTDRIKQSSSENPQDAQAYLDILSMLNSAILEKKNSASTSTTTEPTTSPTTQPNTQPTSPTTTTPSSSTTPATSSQKTFKYYYGLTDHISDPNDPFYLISGLGIGDSYWVDDNTVRIRPYLTSEESNPNFITLLIKYTWRGSALKFSLKCDNSNYVKNLASKYSSRISLNGDSAVFSLKANDKLNVNVDLSPSFELGDIKYEEKIGSNCQLTYLGMN